MDYEKLKEVIGNISTTIRLPEDKLQELIDRYSSKSESEVIKELSQIVYKELRFNKDVYDKCLEIIRQINPEKCPDNIQEMDRRLSKIFSNDIEGNMPLEENHKLINDSIVQFTQLFNENGIDYYIVGALPCFIKTGIKLFRYHDDIDIMVNEKDIPKIAEIIKTTGYIFHDDRFPSLERCMEMEENKPPHTVLAQNPDNEFHLGFFTFRREPDGSITKREYSHRLENGEVIVDVLERQSGPIGTELRFDETPVEYLGTSFKIGSLEDTYALKGYTKRPKDITDMNMLKPYIDENKLKQLREHPNDNLIIHNVKQDTINNKKI